MLLIRLDDSALRPLLVVRNMGGKGDNGDPTLYELRDVFSSGVA